ncbi:beta-galactosidase [Dactylosporangium sp. NPDC050588]|uniref:beta-galactosidase n=1 Tax=Dactylosporangium sp. NPDC050588 TaxID=3157211 RepID=UPI0033D88249
MDQLQPSPRFPRGLDAIAYGGDYAPEQWPEEVWAEDVRLMRQAGVNLVSVGIFSWAMLEPAEGQYTFEWLDRVLELLHANGIRADLATPTAAPPPWLTYRYPDARLIDREGHVLGQGGRQSFCPSSAEYARAAATITEQLGRRYGEHPAVALWHVHNEYAGVNPHCYCPGCAEAFRGWLQDRHGDLPTLNAAWGTTFWSQRYSDWAEIEPPHAAPTPVNPAQQLDFFRFCSDVHLENFRRERDILRGLSPEVPVTTNFMIANCKWVDYWKWAGEVDVVANDHYLQAERDDPHIELAMCADLTRSLAGGAPWMLMEHSTSAVNWQPRNIAKRRGELTRNSLAHLARGADAVLFFQWRASRFGAEKFHSAMLPHGGTSTRIWREVTELGGRLAGLDRLRGTRVKADVAIVWDWESWWALELEWRPSVDLAYRERIEAYYTALWKAHLTVDFVHPEAALSRYPLVVVPSLYLTTAAAAKNLDAYVTGGGTLLVSYFSGIVDANDTVHGDAHPGALRDLLGVTVEEFLPLRQGRHIELSDGTAADVWAEDLVVDTAEVVLTYSDGPAAGGPAVTRKAHGGGTAWYVSTRPDAAGLERLLARILPQTGLSVRHDVPETVEVVRRPPFVIAINHGEHAAEVGGRVVEAGAVTVIEEA